MFIINYTKSFYEKRISELESCYERLQKHCDNLENYKDSLYQVWDDDQARKYFQILSEQIQGVRNAAKKTEEIKRIHEEAMNQLDQLNQTADSILDAGLNMLGGLNIKK